MNKKIYFKAKQNKTEKATRIKRGAFYTDKRGNPLGLLNNYKHVCA